MAIDLVREKACTIDRARKELLPHLDGKAVSQATAYRWVNFGAAAGDGTHVRLEAARIGRVLVTTAEAVERFLEKLGGAAAAAAADMSPADGGGQGDCVTALENHTA